jgi:hypothetical protein
MRGSLFILFLISVFAAAAASAATSPMLTVLYTSNHDTNFKDPSDFTGTPLIDGKGNLFVTANFGGAYTLNALGPGAVLKLSPPPAGKNAWTPTILHAFGKGTDGYAPAAGLLADRLGNLYTATQGGGANGAGAVIMLSPPSPSGTAWTEKVIYSFGSANDGAYPQADLLFDAAGNLYTTTAQGGMYGQGMIARLSPPAAGKTAWTEAHLFDFGNNVNAGGSPNAGLIADSAGNLYTTTRYGSLYSDGTVLKFSPPVKGETAWEPQILHIFSSGKDGAMPAANLLSDAAGNLYTTTLNGGDLLACPNYGCGTVVKLSPPVAGQTKWTETVIYRFKGGNTADPYHGDGASPSAKLIADAAGNLYTTTNTKTH